MEGPDLTSVRSPDAQQDIYSNSADQPQSPATQPQQPAVPPVPDSLTGHAPALDVVVDTNLPAAGMRDGGMPGSQLDE